MPWNLILTIATIIGYLLTLLVVPIVLLQPKKRPQSTVAWIMIIIALPYVGVALFWLFGINRVERRAQRKQEAARALGRSQLELSQSQLIPAEALDPLQERLMRVATNVASTVPTVGNRVEVYSDTHRTIEAIEKAVRAARHSLHLEYYIWRPDRVGTRLRDLCIEKAKEGVSVRVLYDGIGSMWLSRRFLRPMHEAGIHVATFLPGTSFRQRWSINLRMHRKIVVVDGQIGFTGGMNIGDEYLGRDPGYGFWRDTHLRLRGPTVLQLQQIFAEDWYYATGEELTLPEFFPRPTETGDVTAQALSGEPAGDSSVFHTVMFSAINAAEHSVSLTASYFVPPESLVAALEAAAYRGVEVRIPVARKGSYLWTVEAGRSYYESLLKAGAEIYEYERGLLHSKVLIVDGVWSLVGSPNFDVRSLHLNFEVAVAMYDGKIALRLEEQFHHDLEDSRKIELAEWQERSLLRQVGENVFRLFEPVL